MPDHEEIRSALRRELEQLEKTRDELRVQLNLAAADARDQFNELERKLRRVEEELNRIGGHAQESLEEIGKVARDLAAEVKAGFKRLRDQQGR